MRSDEALRQLLVHLAAQAANPPNEPAEHAADEILAAVAADPVIAGRMILAIASLVIFDLHESHSDSEAALEIFLGAGGVIPNFRELLFAMLDARRHGEQLNAEAIRLCATITAERDDAALVLWAVASYLAIGCNRGPEPPAEVIDAFVESCVRQELIDPAQELPDSP